MAIKYLLLLCAAAPLVTGIAKSYFVTSYTDCHIRTLHVREEADRTIMTHGQWWIRASAGNGHGLFYGRIRFYDRQGEPQRNMVINRSFRFITHKQNGLFETEIQSVSRLSGDRFSDEEIGHFVSPMLVKGYTTPVVLFRTRSGNLLGGLPERPVVNCEPAAGPPV
ncbi:hypothetical protein [Pantoea sp. M_9]|uniref:hypothetical protein n=1 Tax=Pantoea sp. M_9 TaxID=2608041 RepID=UPI00123186C2|nr:hypothetical protein [Pantoea sp. M_9]KAA5971618.1 hypothetical protein F3I15_05545 [Pantoea sp. M_9]